MKNFIVTFSIILCGCAPIGRTNPQVSTPSSDSHLVYIEKSKFPRPWSNEGLYVPNWIDNPSLGGKYEAAIGSVLDNTLSNQEKMDLAIKRAIAEISRARCVHIKSIQKVYESESTTHATQYMDDTTSTNTQEVIQNCKMVESWTHPKTGEFFVWMVVR